MSDEFLKAQKYVFFTGVQHIDQCPVESKIPIYLIVLGAFGLLRDMIACRNRLKNDGEGEATSGAMNDGEDEELSERHMYCQLLTVCFILPWFICGNVWVYKNYTPSFQPGDSNYCDKTLYLFAFWLNTSVYIVIGGSTTCVCCFDGRI